MTMLPADCAAVTTSPGTPAPSTLEKFLRVMSVATMLMTVPQVLAVWVGRDAGGVCGSSTESEKRDKTIYLACIGWIALDAAIIIGVMVHR
jgi:hypothetical protein